VLDGRGVKQMAVILPRTIKTWQNNRMGCVYKFSSHVLLLVNRVALREQRRALRLIVTDVPT
jgi:hypothetical protein